MKSVTGRQLSECLLEELQVGAIEREEIRDDVAHAALYLASEDSSWLTGVILDVAGGAVLR